MRRGSPSSGTGDHLGQPSGCPRTWRRWRRDRLSPRLGRATTIRTCVRAGRRSPPRWGRPASIGPRRLGDCRTGRKRFVRRPERSSRSTGRSFERVTTLAQPYGFTAPEAAGVGFEPTNAPSARCRFSRQHRFGSAKRVASPLRPPNAPRGGIGSVRVRCSTADAQDPESMVRKGSTVRVR